MPNESLRAAVQSITEKILEQLFEQLRPLSIADVLDGKLGDETKASPVERKGPEVAKTNGGPESRKPIWENDQGRIHPEGDAKLPATPSPPRGRRGRRPRRTTPALERIVDRILDELRKHPQGLRAEALKDRLGYSTYEVRKGLALAMEMGQVTKYGNKRATTYTVR